MVLERIVEAKREEVFTAKGCCPLSELKKRIDVRPVRDFVGAVWRDERVGQGEAVGPAAGISSVCDFLGEMRLNEAVEWDEMMKRKQEQGARGLEIGDPVSFTGQFPGKKRDRGDGGSESLGTDGSVNAGTGVAGIKLIAEIKKASPAAALFAVILIRTRSHAFIRRPRPVPFLCSQMSGSFRDIRIISSL